MLNLPDELSLRNYAVVHRSFEIVSVFRLPSAFAMFQMKNEIEWKWKIARKKWN